jgi:hypothetical protein
VHGGVLCGCHNADASAKKMAAFCQEDGLHYATLLSLSAAPLLYA